MAKKALERGVSFMNDVAEATLFVLIKDKNLPATKYWLSHRHSAYSEKLQFIKDPKLDDRKIDNGKLTREESELIKRVIKLDYGKDWNKESESLRTTKIYKSLAYNIAL